MYNNGMSKENSCVELRGVTTDNKKFLGLTDKQIDERIERLGSDIADRLNPLVKTVKGKGVLGGFYFWNFEGSFEYYMKMAHKGDYEHSGLSLKAGDFYVDQILFFHDEEFGFYSLSMIGSTYRSSELWNGFGSELQVSFKNTKNGLKFSEAVFIGMATHQLGSEAEFDISKKSELQIMHIADRATRIFTRMCLLPSNTNNP
jgi:hypothetical protein